MQSSNDSHTNGNAGRDTRDGGGNGGGLGGKEAGGLSAVRKAVPTKWLVVMEEGSAQDCTVGTAAAAAADDDDDDNGSRGGLCSLPMQQGDLGVWDLGQVRDGVQCPILDRQACGRCMTEYPILDRQAWGRCMTECIV
eukprot:1159504-Pelagomonas_calceolata.AAC.19